jgi:DNA-binding NarL/FixJ family response regulator
MRVLTAGDSHAVRTHHIGVTPRRAPQGFASALPVSARSLDVLERLSPREHHIAELVAEGHGNKEIAVTLFLSEKTVKTRSHACTPSSASAHAANSLAP